MELDIFNKIKRYWNKAIGSSENKPDEKFSDATAEKSVRASEFLCNLNLDPVISLYR